MGEIAFAINSQDTIAQGCLVLDLLEAEKEGLVYHVSPPKDERTASQWRLLAKQTADQEALTFLLKEELLFQKQAFNKTPRLDSLILKQVHIPLAQVFSAFKLLAPTQKLFFKGKQLAIDLFGQVEFYYDAVSSKPGRLESTGCLRWRDKTIALSECEAIGPGKPHWFVHGISLKMIKTDISWKKLLEARQGPLIFEGTAKQIFLEDFDPEDPDTPQLVIKEGSLEEASQSAIPYPLLVLNDRWGAFADLWMDYGNGQRIAFNDPRPLIKDAQGRLLIKRQLEAEAGWEKDLLETDFIKKAVGSSHYYCPMDRVAKSLTFLLEVGWRIQDWQERQVIKQSGLELKFEDFPQAIAIKGHLRYETHQAEVGKVLGAFNRRELFIQLSPHAVGLLPADANQQTLKDLAEESEFVGDEARIKKTHFGALGSLWEHAVDTESLSESLKALKEQWQSFSKIREALPSPAFQGQLRPYQQQGLNWLAFLEEYGFHGILADEMGLGKTVQVLALLSRISCELPHLIVMPTSLLFNWRNEIHQFLPSFTCLIHQGPKRATRSEDLLKAQVILTSYTTLRLDLELLRNLAYSCVILDEAQMIKNPTTQIAQAVCQLNARMRLSVTGTPIENHMEEIWSHFHFLIPNLFGSQENFAADLLAAQADRRYLDRIKRKITPFLLRRRKQDVAKDLPPRIDQTVWIEMHEEQRIFYDQLLLSFKSGLLKKVEMEGIRRHRMEVLEAILRLRQACCHPLLLSSWYPEFIPASAKFDTLLEDLETIVEEGHKVLVYSQFTSMLKLMAKAAKERCWHYGYLDGSTSNREEVVERFQKDPAQSLFFVSLKAGGVGLNLTAADYVYLYEPWWNEAVEEQAINRAHRIGRRDHVIAKRFVVAESVEEKMVKLKTNKRMMIEEIFDTDTTNPLHLTLEDLQYLLT